MEIPLDVIHRFELSQTPYPLPFLRSAWLGILFLYPDRENSQGRGDNPGKKDQHTEISTHNIWFLKLPLDEQGLLQQAARDDFLHRILEKFGERFDESSGVDHPQPELDDNPYGFTPRDDRMAAFHARISKQLGNPPSHYYAHARDYFAGKAGYDQWNFVGLQGIADVAARLDEENNVHTLVQAIPHLPITPFAALCSCLENVAIDQDLTQVIATRISKALEDEDVMAITAGIRGLSHSTDRDTVIATIRSVLDHPAGHNVEVLAAIAARAWESLENPALRFSFLEALALCDAGQRAFVNIMADLLFLPGLRQTIKEDLGNPKHSDRLVNAIGTFFESVQKVSPSH